MTSRRALGYSGAPAPNRLFMSQQEHTATHRLEERFRKIARLEHAETFLDWDRSVMMPPGGNAPRADALAELASLTHELRADPSVGAWLDEAEADVEAGDAATVERASLREMRREWLDASAVPSDLVRAQVFAGARCEQGWRTQRLANDWHGFLDNFRPVVKLAREEAAARQAAAPARFKSPYDALLDRHCRGDDQALVTRVFDALRTRLPALLQEVTEKQESLDALPAGHYPVAAQKALSERVMRRLGFDFENGRLDTSLHPFSTGVRGDQRITTRYRESEFFDALQATAHETGHASYESGLPIAHEGLPLGQSRNMCIHESQSLLFEKHLMLSQVYLGAVLGDIHEHLPTTQNIEATQLWHQATRVAPSFIRVEADEIGYPLHVMLRHDIESALINGSMEAESVPDAWEEGMQSAFGLSVGDEHSRGCLQDIHWTDGSFGYFPSYTLGAVNAAQIMDTIRAHEPEWLARLAAGDTAFVRDWLAAAVWSKGRLYESQELMVAATGSGTDADYLVRHLEARYLDESD